MAPDVDDAIDTSGGIVGGERTFEWLVIPERAGDFTIPPFALDVVDPATASVRHVESQPIAFAARGEAIAPPETTADAPAPDAEDEELGTIAPLRVRSDLRRAAPPITTSPWVLVALVAPFLLAAAVAVVRAVRARLAERRSTTDTAERRARATLTDARNAARAPDVQKFYGSITSAIHFGLEDVLGEPTVGLARDDLRGKLRSAGIDADLSTRILDELESADFARFSAAALDADEMERCVERVGELFRTLRKEAA
jgi:hypothetical protein